MPAEARIDAWKSTSSIDAFRPDQLIDPAQRDSVPGPERAVRRWLEQVVIGLELCPFAAAPWRCGAVRLVTSRARSEESLLLDIHNELLRLDSADPRVVETTLILVADMLADFDAFNQFLDLVDGLLEQCGWAGRFQAASFHPNYCFADSDADDPGNLTNRAPYPILHLIREDSISRAVAHHPDPDGIPERNIARLRDLPEAQRARLFPYLLRTRS
jgi:hypothetical protein